MRKLLMIFTAISVLSAAALVGCDYSQIDLMDAFSGNTESLVSIERKRIESFERLRVQEELKDWQ